MCQFLWESPIFPNFMGWQPSKNIHDFNDGQVTDLILKASWKQLFGDQKDSNHHVGERLNHHHVVNAITTMSWFVWKFWKRNIRTSVVPPQEPELLLIHHQLCNMLLKSHLILVTPGNSLRFLHVSPVSPKRSPGLHDLNPAGWIKLKALVEHRPWIGREPAKLQDSKSDRWGDDCWSGQHPFFWVQLRP